VTALQIVLSVLFAGALVFTVAGYGRKYGALSARSRLFRTVGMVLLDLLIGLFLAYTFADFQTGVTRKAASIREIFYLSSCLFLGLTLLCVALLDSLESIVAVRRERRGLAQDMVRDVVAQVTAAQQGGDGASETNATVDAAPQINTARSGASGGQAT